MDWGHVSVGELIDALREVEWSHPPRPLAEFFQKFSGYKNAAKWQGRVKCNLYYYRTNYLCIVFLALCFSFLRRPFALLATIFSFIGLSCLNDSFALSFNERLVRNIRKISPPLASKLRAPSRQGARGRNQRGSVYICGQDRRLVVGLVELGSVYMWYASRGFYPVLMALITSFGLIFLHATFRTQNLKARLNSYSNEFRAAWRGYRDAP